MSPSNISLGTFPQVDPNDTELVAAVKKAKETAKTWLAANAGASVSDTLSLTFNTAKIAWSLNDGDYTGSAASSEPKDAVTAFGEWLGTEATNTTGPFTLHLEDGTAKLVLKSNDNQKPIGTFKGSGIPTTLSGDYAGQWKKKAA